MLGLLHGIRVLDLCRLIPGDLATSKLADLGAEVIKVEEPPVGDYIRGVPPIVDGTGFFDLTLNHNKKSLGLNLKSEEGKRIFWELLDTCDALVEVSKPGTFQRLGIDYESVRKVKPDIVYCSVTGYGQTGPYRAFPSHGMNIDAAAGMMSLTWGPTGRPEVRRAPAIGMDMGGIHAALGIAAALVQKLRTGQGQYLDISCWDSAIAANRAFGTVLNFGERVTIDPFAKGSVNQGPKYNVYATKDEKVILICPIERKFWISFCHAVERDDWLDRGTWAPGQMDLGGDDPTLRDDIEEVIRLRTLDEWIEIFLAADVPASPVLSTTDLLDNAHVEARQMVVGTDDPRYPNVKFVRPPLRLPDQEFSVVIPPPVFGEHTDAIMASLGYDAAALARLAEARVIFQATKGV